MKATSLILAVFFLEGCAQIPKSYQWDTVDCTYKRGTEGLQPMEVEASCEFKGRAEMRSPRLLDLL